MKTFLSAGQPLVLLFDIDNTLYHHGPYLRQQIDCQVECFAEYNNISIAVGQRIIEDTRNDLQTRDGLRPSLAKVFTALGIPIEKVVAWRRERIHPEKYLSADPDLDVLLGRLGTTFRLGALTNNPVSVGRRTLDVLGIADRFESVTGIDSTWEAKPSWAPFQHALDAMGISATSVVMIGDRYDVDLVPVLNRGGQGLLIENREELLNMSAIFEEAYGLSVRR